MTFLLLFTAKQKAYWKEIKLCSWYPYWGLEIAALFVCFAFSIQENLNNDRI